MKRLQFETTINAPVEVVWDSMLSVEGYSRWTKAFSEGSYYEGSWSQGARIRFLDSSGDGMVAEIAENRPNAFLSIRHLGYVANGIEDLESDSVRAWAPAYENYTLSAVPGGTRVVIDQDVTADFEEYIENAWPNALEELKRLCESRGTAEHH